MSVLRSVGRCIYCDATGVPLSKEHILPVSLGGSDVLLDAVCRKCQSKINDGFESRLLRSSLLAFRSALGLPTRNRARRPITMPVEVNRGGIWTTEELEVDGLPAQVSWPVMKAPAFLEGRDAIGITFRSFRTIALNRPAPGRPLHPALARLGADQVRMTFKIQPFDLARELAKIGYVYSIAEYGAGVIEPFVLPPNHDASRDVGTWVGAVPSPIPDTELVGSHTIRIETRIDGVILARVQLFTEVSLRRGVPGYLVVVGRLRRAKPGDPLWVPASA
jgi:hypothetical protein